jgi:hypothetical protein
LLGFSSWVIIGGYALFLYRQEVPPGRGVTDVDEVDVDEVDVDEVDVDVDDEVPGWRLCSLYIWVWV